MKTPPCFIPKTSKTHLTLLAGVLAVGVATTAQAQLGSGWRQRAIEGYIDVQSSGNHTQHDVNTSFTFNGARYTTVNGDGALKRFELISTASNRVEHDSDYHYDNVSGKTQFEGEVQIFPGVSQQSVVQVFGGGAGGPALMIKGYGRNNGSLVLTKNTSVDLITDCFSGKWVKINIIHDVSAHHMELYINGALAWEGADSGSGYTGGYNIKYGLYGSLTAASAKVEWRNVKIWRHSNFVRIMARHSGKALNVSGASTADGADIIQWTYTSATPRNDEWEIINVGTGYSRIMCRNGGKAVNVNGASLADGADVIQWTYTSSSPSNDEWRVIDIGGGFCRILNRNSGKALNVEGVSMLDGADVIQWTYSNNSSRNDEWQIINVP